jgi:molecular chaperone HtpG
VRWVSGGTGEFTVESLDMPTRGTRVILHLREDAAEYLSSWKLKGIISKYSDHISLPILMRKEEWKEGENDQPGEMVVTDEWETVNKANALWTRAKKDISA